jgi:hypothetical protein
VSAVGIRQVGERWVDEQLVAVGSIKGGTGATTLALGVAAGWPLPGAVLVEVDPDGGDLAARFGHHPDPGLVGLVAAARSGGTAGLLHAHVQRLRLDVDVVLARPGDAAAAAVQALAQGGTRLLREAAGDATVVLDVGRLGQGGPGLTMAAMAGEVVLVVRPTLEELIQVQTRLGWLREAIGGRLWLALSGPGFYGSTEVARVLGVEIIGDLPRDDRSGAGVLAGRLVGRGWRKMRLPRAARSIALRLHEARSRQAAPPVHLGALAEVNR